LGETLAAAAARLEQAGAEAILICANTMHKLYEAVDAAVEVPVLHIADPTAAAIRAAGCSRPILLATRYTMEQDFYVDGLARGGVEPVIPGPEAREAIHRIIFEELCLGVVDPASKARYLEIVTALLAEGADSLILGCTEIGLLLSQNDLDPPVFDTTEIHVRAALEFALGRDGPPGRLGERRPDPDSAGVSVPAA
jgi:aspartate racemase